MIKEIAQAIIQHYNASTDLRDVLTGLYFQQAPQNATSPYAVFYITGISHDELMGVNYTNSIINAEIQFSIFENAQDGGSSLAIAADLLDNAFHWAEIYVDGSSGIKMQRQVILPVMYIDEIWQVSITYELSFQKS